MSYSRWINSKFYTYWNSTEAHDKEDEIFICHTDIQRYYKFSYTECKRFENDLIGIKGSINEINDDAEAKELQGYVKQFIKDVDQEYQ